MKKKQGFDWWLLSLVLVLLLFGLVILISASTILSLERFETPYYYVGRQLFQGVAGGLIILLIMLKLPLPFLKKIAWPFFIGALGLNAILLLKGVSVASGGAERWLALGPIVFQPSEILKLGYIILLSSLLDKRATFWPFIFLTSLAALVILPQPDLGTFLLLAMTGIVIFFVSGARWREIFLTIGVLLASALGFAMLASYRLSRILTFLNPDRDPAKAGYQIKQALLAFGSGGLLGLGLGESRQKYSYLPAAINDSIFAIIGEEFGFVGVLAVISLFLVLAWRGLRIAARAENNFNRLLATGITSWISLQTFINIMGIINLLPLTGIPLPFISYGSSAMIATLAGIGILLNISRQTRK